MTETKPCIRCGEVKPATLEYFARSRGEILRNVCKKCRNDDRKRQYHTDHDRNLERNRAYVERNREYISARRKEYRQKNKDEIAAYMKIWRTENKERIREQSAIWYQSNLERARSMCRIYHINNKYRMNERSREWQRLNPERSKALGAKYRARRMGASGNHTAKDVAHIRDLQDNCCRYCGVSLEAPIIAHLDHFIPLSRGGSNSPDNLAWSCGFCNTSKLANLPWEWPRWNGVLPVLYNL
jgi:hypothetical protein